MGRAQNIDSLINQSKRLLRNSHSVGKGGEEFVADILERDGHLVLERNFRTRFAEIDIVALIDDVCTFIEVKTNKIGRSFPISERVDERKIHKIMHCSELWLSINTTYSYHDRALYVYEIECRGFDFSVANITEVRV